MPVWLDELVLRSVDALFARRRYPRPPDAQLAAAKLISHRGERDGGALENTFAAFDPLRGSGVHGIEFDVRWTRDLVPVVYHDATFERLFGESGSVGALTWDELHRRHPQIPDLRGLVARYTDEFHLMAEVKPEPYPDPPLQSRRLAEALAPALARGRCHVLSLAPAMFALLPDLPARATMGVARLDARAVSDEALASRRGGFSCHYANLTAGLIARHHAAGQAVGCGFPDSEPVLYREVARGVDYLFTNHALALRRLALRGNPAPRG